MKTIKIILFAIILFAATNISAQINPISFGIKGGVNLSNYSGDLNGTKSKVGFNVGLTMDVALPSNLYIASGLEFTTKGFGNVEEKEGGITVTLEGSQNAMYLQIPVHLGYKVEIAPMTKIVFHAGPYFAYGIGGKFKFDKVKMKQGGQEVTMSLDKMIETIREEGIYSEEELMMLEEMAKEHDTFGDYGMKRFDFGIGLGAGVEFNKFTVGIGYDFGLKNIGDDTAKAKNLNGYLSVGYKF